MASSTHFHGVEATLNPRFTSTNSFSFENLKFRASISIFSHQCRFNDTSFSNSNNIRLLTVNCLNVEQNNNNLHQNANLDFLLNAGEQAISCGLSNASYDPELAAIPVNDLHFSHQSDSDHQSTIPPYLISSIDMMNQSEPSNLPKVLLLRPPPVFTYLESEFSRHFHFIKPYTSTDLPLPKFLAAVNATGVTAMLAGGRVNISAVDVLDHLPELRCIVTSTAGLNYIDVAECQRRGITIASAGDSYSDDCADAAVALLIDVMRKVSAGDRFVLRGDWATQRHYFLGRQLKGKKVGIIGLGSIGCRIAKRLEAFGCIIQYNSRKEKPSVSYPFYADVGELATNSDVLVISCALTDQTRHMINKEVLSALGKEGVIINIARGRIIDEKELVRFLVEGKIAGAGLDVFENEPSVPKELFSMDNVVLTPHAAFLTDESFRDVFELVKGNLLAFFSNKPLLSAVVDV